jgi:hypothetical protein
MRLGPVLHDEVWLAIAKREEVLCGLPEIDRA